MLTGDSSLHWVRFYGSVEKVSKLHDGLSRPKTVKKLAAIQRRIGRLQEANARAAKNYKVTVTPDEKGKKVARIEWTCEPANGSMMQHPGVYCLRSNILN